MTRQLRATVAGIAATLALLAGIGAALVYAYHAPTDAQVTRVTLRHHGDKVVIDGFPAEDSAHINYRASGKVVVRKVIP